MQPPYPHRPPPSAAPSPAIFAPKARPTLGYEAQNVPFLRTDQAKNRPADKPVPPTANRVRREHLRTLPFGSVPVVDVDFDVVMNLGGVKIIPSFLVFDLDQHHGFRRPGNRHDVAGIGM